MSRFRVRSGAVRARKTGLRAPEKKPANARTLVVVIVVLVAGTFAVRLMGYKLGRETVVRCRSGHLFTTVWIPGASLKAVRLGMVRWQRCPVGKHWTLISPVREADLTDAERQLAAQSHDVRVP